MTICRKHLFASLIVVAACLSATAAGAQTTITLASGLRGPAGVAVDAAGNVIVAVSQAGTVLKLDAAAQYSQSVLYAGFTDPSAVSIDRTGDIFATDRASGLIAEIASAGGIDLLTQPPGGYFDLLTIFLDSNENLYAVDSRIFSSTVYKYSESSGYTTITQVSVPPVSTFDGAGNRFSVNTDGTVTETLAAGGSRTIATGAATVYLIAVDLADNIFVTTGKTVVEVAANNGYATPKTIGTNFESTAGITTDYAGNVYVADALAGTVNEILTTPPALESSVLPGARSVQLGNPATIFATMINTGATALDTCSIALSAAAPSGLTLSYQTTNPATNALIGTPNTPVTLAGANGSQSFLIALQGTSAFSITNMPLTFACDGSPAAVSIPGVNTLDLMMSTAPVVDIIALAATAGNTGIVVVPEAGSAAFAIASTNIGAEDAISVTPDTGSAKLPVTATICQTDPGSGQCLYPATNVAKINYANGATPTFSIFLHATGTITLAPATARVFVRFEDDSGNIHGSTSVAIETN